MSTIVILKHPMFQIAAIQAREEAERVVLELELQDDHLVAAAAETSAKEAETEQQLADAKEAAKESTGNTDDIDWVLRNRPGADAKPGANLKAASASVNTSSERKDRDQIPSSGQTNTKAGGSYFGESPKEQERARRAAEEALKATETNKISSGAGDRRRELESKISPAMRARAAADAAKRLEAESEAAAWEVRASVSRRFARPVEKVLRACGDDDSAEVPSMYAILGVKRDAEDDVIKKAYRVSALRIHPGTALYLLCTVLLCTVLTVHCTTVHCTYCALANYHSSLTLSLDLNRILLLQTRTRTRTRSWPSTPCRRPTKCCLRPSNARNTTTC